MSIEYDGRQMSDIRIQQMIDNAVRKGFTPEEIDDLEQRAAQHPPGRRKKSRPHKQAAFVGQSA